MHLKSLSCWIENMNFCITTVHVVLGLPLQLYVRFKIKLDIGFCQHKKNVKCNSEHMCRSDVGGREAVISAGAAHIMKQSTLVFVCMCVCMCVMICAVSSVVWSGWWSCWVLIIPLWREQPVPEPGSPQLQVINLLKSPKHETKWETVPLQHPPPQHHTRAHIRSLSSFTASICHSTQ